MLWPGRESVGAVRVAYPLLSIEFLDASLACWELAARPVISAGCQSASAAPKEE